MGCFYHFSGLLVRMLFLLLTRRQVRGRENILGEGSVLIVSNHISLVDIPLLGISFGRKVIFMAKKELFRFRFLNYFMRILASFPVHRGRLDREALRQSLQVLADGMALVIFPEGTRSNSARLRPAFSGSALVALRSGVPVLPVGIAGTEKFKGVGGMLRRPQVTVNIGRPFYLPSINSRPTKVELAKLSDFIMRRIAELLPPEYRGHYAREVD